VYLAPPQYQGLAARALAELDAAPLVPAGGLVIVQIHPRERGDLDGLHLQRLHIIDERRYGSTLLVFYEPVQTTQSDAPSE
jgi:16S rRNA (guanine966-N2)-methyltransferase